MGGDVVRVLLAITTIALVATLVVNANGTAKVVSATAGGFTNALATAQKG